MFSKAELQSFRNGFEACFPEYAAKLNACATESDFHRQYQSVLADAIGKAKPYLGVNETFPVIGLTPNWYRQLATAEGANIKVLIGTMLASMQLVKPDWTVGQVTGQFMASGITALTKSGVEAFGEAIETGAKLAEAIAHAIGAIGVGGVYAVVALLIVAVIIPILYFMLKPACCFICVLNETSQPLVWADDFNVHGKPVGQSRTIPPALSKEENYVTCGFVQTDKRDDALVGTQYGFTYRYDAKNTVSFGTECPLTAIYVNNSCYCAINSSSQNVADQTDDHNVLTWKAAIASPSLSALIACNSGSGSVAFYIARVRDGTINPG